MEEGSVSEIVKNENRPQLRKQILLCPMRFLLLIMSQPLSLVDGKVATGQMVSFMAGD